MVPLLVVECRLTIEATSGIHIVLDIWLIALPIKTLMSVRRPIREKVALIVIFGLGVFSATASIVRLYSIRIFTLSKDPFFDVTPVNLWSMIEVNIAIVCASIPALKCLVSPSQRARTRSATDKRTVNSMLSSQSYRAHHGRTGRESTDSIKKIRQEWNSEYLHDNQQGGFELAPVIGRPARDPFERPTWSPNRVY